MGGKNKIRNELVARIRLIFKMCIVVEDKI